MSSLYKGFFRHLSTGLALLVESLKSAQVAFPNHAGGGGGGAAAAPAAGGAAAGGGAAAEKKEEKKEESEEEEDDVSFPFSAERFARCGNHVWHFSILGEKEGGQDEQPYARGMNRLENRLPVVSFFVA